MHTMKGYSASSASSSRIVDFASIDSASTMRVLAALQIDRAVNVDALAPARLLDRELLSLGRPAAHGPRRMGWMHRIHEHRDLVVAHGIHQVFVARNERLLRFRIELARDDFGLVIFESQAMQQRDQARAAFVDEAEFLGDPGADLVERGRVDPTQAFRASHCSTLILPELPPISKRLSPSTPLCSKSSYQPRIVSSSNKRTSATS